MRSAGLAWTYCGMRAISTHGVTTPMTTPFTAVESAVDTDDSNCATVPGETPGPLVAPLTSGSGSVAGFACSVGEGVRVAERHSATRTTTNARTKAQTAMRAVRRGVMRIGPRRFKRDTTPEGALFPHFSRLPGFSAARGRFRPIWPVTSWPNPVGHRNCFRNGALTSGNASIRLLQIRQLLRRSQARAPSFRASDYASYGARSGADSG